MAQNLFKTRYLPNADGSESSTALTNTNCVFIHTYLGDDNTGDGTRQKPYRSVVKATLKSGTYILFRGLIYEAATTGKIIIGDDRNQVIMSQTMLNAPISRATIGINVRTGHENSYFNGSIVDIGNVNNNPYGSTITNSLCKYLNCGSFPNYSGIYQNTITYATNINATNTLANNRYNLLISNSYTLVSANVSYTVFSGVCVFKTSSGANIIHPNLTEDSVYNIQAMRDAYTNSGGTASFGKDAFNNETCKVIKETNCGGTHPNIFNSYDINRTGKLYSSVATGAKTSIRLITDQPAANWPTTGDLFIPIETSYVANGVTMPVGSFEVWTYTSVTVNGLNDITLTGSSYAFKTNHNSLTKTCIRYGDVKDYSLNPDPGNEALWASYTGGYVGAMRPAYDSIQANMTSVVVVDESTGADTVMAGDLIYINSAGEFVFNNASTQTWNRFRDSVTKYISLGSSFKGGGGNSTDGSPFGYYIGKKQNLIGATKYYSGDALTVGKWYKVFNDTAISVSNAIIYNSVQYLPEYTFCCVTGVTTFSLLNAGTGTYVMEIIADVLESIEIIPYDDANTESAFPKFSCPINGDCKLLYYTSAGALRYGKTAGNPVLFADLAVANMITDFGNISNKISYYDSWAISNADQEFFVLGDPSLTSPRSTYFTTAIPNIRYYRRSINAHFDKPYDY